MGQKVSAVARRREPQGGWRTQSRVLGKGRYGEEVSYREKRRAHRREGVRQEGYVTNERRIGGREGRYRVKRERRDARAGRREGEGEGGARKRRRRAGRQRVGRRYGTHGKEVDREIVDRTREREKRERRGRREERRRVKTKHVWPKTRTAQARCEAVVWRYEGTMREGRGERRALARSEGRKHKEVRGYRDRRRSKAWERRPEPRRRRGYRVEVKGTLNGSRRSRTQVRQRGKVPRSEREAQRGGGRLDVKSKVGTRGVRRVCSYARGVEGSRRRRSDEKETETNHVSKAV